MEWVYGLGDARISSVEQDGRHLSVFLDCSYTQLHPANYIRQIQFLNYQIVENTDLAGLFWDQDCLKQTGRTYELRLRLCDSKNHRKQFVIRFSHAEIIRADRTV